MKRFTTQTLFRPLSVQNDKLEIVKNSAGKPIEFKTRKSIEAYCAKNRCIYVEVKHIFYR
jgi:hypothetical protein